MGIWGQNTVNEKNNKTFVEGLETTTIWLKYIAVLKQ